MAESRYDFRVRRGDTYNGASFEINIFRTYPSLANFPAVGDASLIYRAADTLITYLWNGSAYVVTTNVNPMNLTGASILVQFRNDNNGSVVLELSIGRGITITDAPNGKFQIDAQIIPTSVPGGSYPYDIRITLANGVVKHYISGTMTVEETYSRG